MKLHASKKLEFIQVILIVYMHAFCKNIYFKLIINGTNQQQNV
jgi:hypothetical protein